MRPKIGLALLVLFLALTLLAACDGGTTSQTTSNHPSAPVVSYHVPTRTPTSQPTATPNPNAGLKAYIAVAQPDIQAISNDFTAAGNDCGVDTNACYNDMQQLDADVHTFQADLDANPAPPCLKDADKNLRTALDLLDEGAQAVMAGINQNDSTQVEAGSTDITQANTYLNRATTAMQVAVC